MATTIEATGNGLTSDPTKWSPARAVIPSDEVDLAGCVIVQAAGLTGVAKLIDTLGGGSFEIVNDFICPVVETPLICNTTKTGNVPIVLDVGVSLPGFMSEAALTVGASGLVDITASVIDTIGTGKAIVNAGTIVGAIDADAAFAAELDNSGTVDLVGELSAVTIANSGTIQSKYDSASSDILGAGML